MLDVVVRCVREQYGRRRLFLVRVRVIGIGILSVGGRCRGYSLVEVEAEGREEETEVEDRAYMRECVEVEEERCVAVQTINAIKSGRSSSMGGIHPTGLLSFPGIVPISTTITACTSTPMQPG